MIWALRIAAYFFIASVVGWCIDTVLRSVRRRRWAPIRKLPFSPAYGLCSFALLFAPGFVVHSAWWVKFLFYALSFSTAEYLLGATILAVSGKRIWDYRDRHLNVQGHADAFHTLIWGVVGTVALTYVHPPIAALLGLAAGLPEGYLAHFGLPIFLIASLGVVAAAMAQRGRTTGALVLLAIYLPQVAVLAWMGRSLGATLGSGVLVGLGAGFGVVMAHRLTTYVFPLPPARWHLLYVAPMHVFQSALFLWLLVWPVSRLLPAATSTDLLAFLGPLALSAVALVFTHRAPHLVERELPTSGFGGLRVAQISDLHVGPYTSDEALAALARRVNALRPDLIALTGDLLTLRYESDSSALYAFIEALDRPPLGIHACSGNHDLAAWDSLASALRSRGVSVLEDQACTLELPSGGRAQIVGLHYRTSGADRVVGYRTALDQVLAPELPSLVLCHDPQVFGRLGNAWSGVMLAGHYHGGQIGLTSLGLELSVLRPFGVRDQGIFGRGSKLLYSHRGTGTYGFPIRLGVPTELALLRLR